MIVKIAGVASLAIGLVLCVPAGSMAWDMASEHQYSFVVISVGRLTLSGSQAWVFLGGCVVLGVALILLGA